MADLDLLPETRTKHEKITQSLHSGHDIVQVSIPSYHVMLTINSIYYYSFTFTLTYIYRWQMM